METAQVKFRIKGTKIYADSLTAQQVAGGQAYDAAAHGRRATTWNVSDAGPNATLAFPLSSLRRRSRDAIRQNGLAESAVKTIESNIVGRGIKPKFNTGDDVLNEELGELFRDWCDEADASGRNTFFGLQALAIRAMVESGEVFARFRNRFMEDVSTVPLQLQLIEAEQCREDEIRLPTAPRNRIVSGVEFNAIGQRVAYWMLRDHPNDFTVLNADNVIPVRVPASEISHIYQVRRPGQVRGEPWLTRALIKMRDLDAYDDAELLRKKTAALFAGFITRPEFDPNDPLFPTQDEDSGIDGDALLGLEPGLLQVLKPGEQIEFSKPADVGSSYADFLRMQQRSLAASVGVLYEQLTGDYSQVSDRQFRAAMLEFRRRASMWQDHLAVFLFCRPVIERWLTLARLFNLVTPPAGMEDRDFFRVDWVPEGWRYIHPLQEVQADRMAVEEGFKSRSQVVAEQGRDVETVDKQIARDNERAEQLGLNFGGDSPAAPTSGGEDAVTRDPVEQDDDEDEEDEEDKDT